MFYTTIFNIHIFKIVAKILCKLFCFVIESIYFKIIWQWPWHWFSYGCSSHQWACSMVNI